MLFDLIEFWHRKIAESCCYFFRSSTSFIVSDLINVGEECERKYSHWEASITNVGPLPDMDNCAGKYFESPSLKWELYVAFLIPDVLYT